MEEKITVQVNDDDTPVLIKLTLDAKLAEIRKILADKPDIRMGDKVYFLDLSRKYNPKIPHEDEEEHCLKDILGCHKNLKITGNIEPQWTEIIVNNSLEYGVFFKEDGPEYATKRKAFKILQVPESILPDPISFDKERICKTEIDEIYLKNLFATTKFGGKLPHFPSIATTDGSYISKSEIHRNNAKFERYCTSVRINAVFNMTKTEIEPTDEFVSAVDEALKSIDPCQSLKQVTEAFGEYWCEEVKLGGSILYVNKKESKVKETADSKDQNASAGLNSNDAIQVGASMGKNQEKKTSNSLEKEYSFMKIRGGSETKLHKKGIPEWLKSLRNYKKWRVIEYSKIHSIFDILAKEKQEKVAEAFGERIIDSQVLKLDIIMDISKPDPFVYEIPKKYDLTNYKIFITEMKDDKSDTIFASRVHYYADSDKKQPIIADSDKDQSVIADNDKEQLLITDNDKEQSLIADNNKKQPVILLHRLGKLKKQSELRKFSVKLGLILLGTSTKLNLPGQNSSQLEFESGESPITVNNANNKCSADIPTHQINLNTSLLATFVSRSNDLHDKFPTSKHIARAHFVNKNDSIEACAFYYDLESRKLDYQFALKDRTVEFLINYSIISGQVGEIKFGRAPIKKFTKSISRRLTRSKRFKILFDDYLDLARKSCLENPIFVNLLLNECPENCPHGVFNITLDHAAFKTIINSSGLQSAQIAYFSVQTFKDNE
ncbi:4876_t:CDS:2 [Ambispora gerdemannii]|uniref:4875_t:CDS:1 n=1 Tax=Ambispora gerdemannii TaxID=144530 RepID=A0A9N9FKS9_9GLOM|nr:4875_t:CDS:2 [Ambispora gerdemannii]CAG8543956.1 4876_t:CDS:2 [Ambispora gerdemannii]